MTLTKLIRSLILAAAVVTLPAGVIQGASRALAPPATASATPDPGVIPAASPDIPGSQARAALEPSVVLPPPPAPVYDGPALPGPDTYVYDGPAVPSPDTYVYYGPSLPGPDSWSPAEAGGNPASLRYSNSGAPLGPGLSELRSVAFETPRVLTPKIWPVSRDADRLAGPPSPPVSRSLSAFAGPQQLAPSPELPFGPPLPALGFPTAYGFVWPVGDEVSFQSPDEQGKPGFRVVRDFNPAGRRGDKHMGVDLSNRQSGSTVRALADGVVALVADRSQGDPMHTGWGNLVVLSHKLPGGQVVYSLLAHLKDRSILVRPGDRVTAGEPIAEVGATGHASGPHLHLEMRKFLNWNVLNMLPDGWQHMGFLNPLNFLGTHLVSFPDLPQTHWAYSFVMPLVRMGVLTAGPTFSPEAPVTVSEFSEMLARAFGPSTTGIGAGSPDQPVQLGQAIGTLQRVLGAASNGSDDPVRSNLILRKRLEGAEGRPMLDPAHPLTRAEAAVLLRTALEADNREPAASASDASGR